MRRAASLLVATVVVAGCGGPPTLSEQEYRQRAARICDDGKRAIQRAGIFRGHAAARRYWRTFSRLRPPRPLAADHRAAVRLDRRADALLGRAFTELGRELAAELASHRHPVAHRRFQRLSRASAAADRARDAALRRLRLPASCSSVAGETFGSAKPVSQEEYRRAIDALRRAAAG